MSVESLPDRVERVLTEISKGIGTTVEYAWPEYVRYAWACGLTGALAGACLMAIGVAAAIAAWRFYRRENYELTFPSIIVAAFSLWLGAVAFFGNLPAVIAPEGKAISEIISNVTR